MKNNQIDSIQDSLNTVKLIEEIKGNPCVKSTIISVLKSVPIIGELIDGTIDALLTDFQERKRAELINLILDDVFVTIDMVNDVEFILNFAKTLEAVNKLSTNEKIKFFANLLKFGYFCEKKITNDKFEEYLYLLSTLSYREISYLFFIFDYQIKHFKVDQDSDHYSNGMIEAFKEQFSSDIFEFVSAYQKLCSTGFIIQFYKTYKPTITLNTVRYEYDEPITISDIQVDIDYFYVTDRFIEFAERVGGKYEHLANKENY